MRPNLAAQWVRGGLRHARPTLFGAFPNTISASAGLFPQSAGQGSAEGNCISYIQSNAYAAVPQFAEDEADHQIRSCSDPLRRSSLADQARREPSLSLSPQRTTDGLSPQRHRRRALPTADEVRRALNGSSGSLCGSSSGSASPQKLQHPQQDAQQDASAPQLDSSTLSWRDVVKAFRASDQQVARPVLTDSYERKHSYLRISLTERCNLRCVYCMPEQGVDLTPSDQLLTTAEIVRLATLFAAEGVTKIRLTGGEPTIRKDIVQLTAELAAVAGVQSVGITTNGIALQRKLAALKANGLTLLNISLDTLREDRFESMTRRRGLSRVLDTIHQAVDMGFDPVKVNVVVMRGQNDDEVLDFVEMTRSVPINIRFIEYMPFDGNVWSNEKMVPFAKLAERINAQYSPGLERLQDPRGEVAKNFRIPGFAGTVSFVTSMTKAFCGDCNRLRLMADGNLKVCLFGANEVSLRDAMREGATDSDLAAVISAAVDRKKAAHAGMFAIAATPNRSMVKIGG